MRRSVLAILLIGFPAVLAACGGGNTGTSSNPASSASANSCPTAAGSTGSAHLKIGSKGFADKRQRGVELLLRNCFAQERVQPGPRLQEHRDHDRRANG